MELAPLESEHVLVAASSERIGTKCARPGSRAARSLRPPGVVSLAQPTKVSNNVALLLRSVTVSVPRAPV
jgi:hypothetical protein